MRYKYVGEPNRVYPSLGIQPAPGDVIELDFVPNDGRWIPVPQLSQFARQSTVDDSDADNTDDAADAMDVEE